MTPLFRPIGMMFIVAAPPGYNPGVLTGLSTRAFEVPLPQFGLLTH